MAVSPIPAGHHTVTPYLVVEDVDAVMNFMTAGLNATEVHCLRTPDGAVAHAEMKVGDSMVMLGGAGGPHKALQAMLHLYVEDCDALYRQALAVGGESIMEPTDQFYGDRSGAVRDPAGNQWWIATHIEDVPDEEIARRALAKFSQSQPE